MQILVIDNFDSFTYNLVQYLGELGASPVVYRNNAVTIEQAAEMQPDAIVISPGPGRPSGAGISMDLIRESDPAIPILGVCLGHQAIARALGGRIEQAPTLMHGKVSDVRHDDSGLFAGLPNPFPATRYHSLVADPDSLPACLNVTARTDDGIVMGITHKERPVYGVQFHPESILTECGKPLLQNFLNLATAMVKA